MDRMHHFMIFTTGKARKQVQEFRIVFRFHFDKSKGLRNGGKSVNRSSWWLLERHLGLKEANNGEGSRLGMWM
jgi:hypothetical protein